MTKRLKICLFIILAAICAACTISACSVGGKTRNEILKDYTGVHVTYYGNGGLFDKSTTLCVRDLYFANYESPFYAIPEDKSQTTAATSQLSVKRTNFDLIGWYEAKRYTSGDYKGEVMYTYQADEKSEKVAVYPIYERNADGTKKVNRYGENLYVTDPENDRPVFAENPLEEDKDKYITELKVLVEIDEDKPVTESDILNESRKNLVVCAKWRPTQKMTYVLKYSADNGEFIIDGNKVEENEVIYTVSFGHNEVVSPIPDEVKSSQSGYTFVANYLDEQRTTPVLGSTKIERPSDGSDVVIYSYYIKDDWTVVKDVKGVREMFKNLNAGKKYYLAYDVDCGGESILFNSSGSATACTIQGNGFAVSNIKFYNGGTEKMPVRVTSGSVISIFGALRAEASITDLKLKDIEISFTAASKAAIQLYALIASAAEGARVQGVSVENLSANLTDIFSLNGVRGEPEDWLFGGTVSDTIKQGVAVNGITFKTK